MASVFIALTLFLMLPGSFAQVPGFSNEEGIVWHEKVRPKKVIEDKQAKEGNGMVENYVIHSSKETFDIILEPQTDLFSPDVSIHNGDHIIQMNDRVLQQCHYSGTFKDGRGRVVMDTCNGMRGVLIDANGHIYYIEPLGDGWYNLTQHNEQYTADALGKIRIPRNRERRSPSQDKNVNDKQNMIGTEKDWKYIQTAFVVDHAFYKWWNGDITKIFNYINSIANYANMLYAQGGFKIAVTMLEIWVDEDKIDMSGKFQRDFEDYNEFVLLGEKGWTHDYAQFLTRKSFGLAGSSLLGTLCRGASAGTVFCWSSNPYKIAGTSAHELGHSIGLEHYDAKCHCPSKIPCVMTHTNSKIPVTNFADCSLKAMKRICEEGYCNCLKDKPGKIFNGPKCGNGFVEADEECDCGDPVTCKNKCCDAATCKLKANAQCANGKCCSQDCTFLPANAVCRAKKGECDLDEVCSGTDNKCPSNVGKEDFTSCNNGEGFCLKSVCSLSLEKQCKLLWGQNAHHGYKKCFYDGKSINSRADKYGNCGTSPKGSFLPCSHKNDLCGKVNCYGKNLPRFVRIGYGRMTKLFTRSENDCRTGTTHVSGIPDPTIAMEGTKCGDGKVCINHACVEIKDQTSLHACHGLCKNGGTCTGNGFCNCRLGFSGPTCNKRDGSQTSTEMNLPKCYGKCNQGVCNVATENCWCPPGTKCPDCKVMDSGNTLGESCVLLTGKRIEREDMNCGPLFQGVFVSNGCKGKLGDKKMGPLNDMIHNYRNDVVWKDMKNSATRITCLCAKEAKLRGYKTFGIQFWGECWGSILSPSEFNSRVSTECNNYRFKPCTSRDNLCIGKEMSTALYSFPS